MAERISYTKQGTLSVAEAGGTVYTLVLDGVIQWDRHVAYRRLEISGPAYYAWQVSTDGTTWVGEYATRAKALDALACAIEDGIDLARLLTPADRRDAIAGAERDADQAAMVYEPLEQTNPQAHSNAPYSLRYGADRPEGNYPDTGAALLAARGPCAVVTRDGWWIVGYVRLLGTQRQDWTAPAWDGKLPSERDKDAAVSRSARHPSMASGPCDDPSRLSAWLQVFEDAKGLPTSAGGDCRTMLLELVEFGSADVAPEVWRENEEGGRYADYQPAELIVRNRARLALNRRERLS